MKGKPADKKFLSTSFGDIAYLESGSSAAPPVLFIHGIPTSGYLWRHVLRFLADDYHCYAPDLMGLGDTTPPAGHKAYHMEAQAEMLVEFMTEMGHESFGIVCHDQGGAAAQVIAARMPDRVECLILTNCVCYDNWPVPAVDRLMKLTRIPLLPGLLAGIGFVELVERRLPFSNFRRGFHDRKRVEQDSIKEYLRPLRAGAAERKRFIRFLLAGHSRYTISAVKGLKNFKKPTMVVWAADDRYLSPSWGLKLFEDIPGARRFKLVPFCGHFWQEERPSEFSSIFLEFLNEFPPEKSGILPPTEKHAVQVESGR